MLSPILTKPPFPVSRFQNTAERHRGAGKVTASTWPAPGIEKVRATLVWCPTGNFRPVSWRRDARFPADEQACSPAWRFGLLLLSGDDVSRFHDAAFFNQNGCYRAGCSARMVTLAIRVRPLTITAP